MSKSNDTVHLNKLSSCEAKFEELKKDLSFGRLGKTFKTKGNFYFYDTGTGKVASISEDMFIVLNTLLKNKKISTLIGTRFDKEKLIEVCEDILFNVESENILSAKIPETFMNNATEGLEALLHDGMTSVTLELTERCNLRCKYCIYHPAHPSFRKFGKRDMNIDIAKKAVDMLRKHSSAEDMVYIGFYGGEPLINYKVIEEIIPYARKTFAEKKIHFSLTTNGCLLTLEIAEFFVKEDVNVIFSLDGPQDIHDENRIYKDETGSFRQTIRGIENLVKVYKDQNKRPSMGINIVTSPPNFEHKYSKIQQFLESCEWYGEHVAVTCSTVDYGASEEEYRVPQSEEEEKRKSEIYNPLEKWSSEYSPERDGRGVFSEAAFTKGLLRIHKRRLLNEPASNYGMNGCCVPGSRKAFVTVEGDILPCERVGGIPSLGNVLTGFEMARIRKNYVDDYIKYSIPKCKECWAINFCGLCYINFFDDKKAHPSYRNVDCIKERIFIEDDLVRYHSILEKDPEYINTLNSMELI